MTEALQYELTQARLDNGLQVVVAPDPDAPGVAVNLWVEVGSADEAPGRTGFAHLFEHLMFQGSANLASGEHMATVESLGGTVNATTSTDRTNYFETVPRGALELALWMEADRFSSLAITPENFEAQRQVVKEEKRQRYDNQPYGDLLQLLTAQHFPESHPYGHLTIGSMADLDAASLEDVSGFFDAWYRACNLRLVVCGPVRPDEALELAGRYFADLPALPKPERRSMVERPVAQASTVAVSRQVPHSLAYLSWPTPPASDADQPAIDLALSILADGHSSRLHRALVKHADVANEVHSASLTHRSAASIAAILGRPADGVSLEAMSSAILDGVGRLAAEGPTDAELARAVAQYESDWLWELATTSGRADAINEAWLMHGSPHQINTHLADVLALTPEHIATAAGRWLAPSSAHQLHYAAEETR
ncbi:insulinase family protein [Tessaracoccus sp. MC1679]|uniref:M16 family metallopeptidase n=1 Tax=Tessaracoccus sp. MC1679 TaxID=2760313 RepID=UPI0015FF0034|nr:pitrilysin family protein [Tessaracoccus sp. MC1679]MBB1516172.1 insulinase family protein [Tessaracoccus sp. MC1679]